MLTYDASSAQCLVYSYKEGLLSKIAHDLKHRATRFALAIDEQAGAIHAEIDARSLRVECVMKDAQESTDTISDDDRKKIEGQIVEDVLHANQHPLITFQSTAVSPEADGFKIDGVLELNGHRKPVTTHARRSNGHYAAELTLHQPDFGIKPFSAMMGALKIKPDVIIRMVVPAR
ncbi:MAG: YceI family protein [Polyangiales bacterium]